MQLHDIAPKVYGQSRKSKRLGRGPGSGRGKTSARGHKGEKARAGRLFYIGFEGDNVPFFRKISKRGFFHKKRFEIQIVNVKDINAKFRKDNKVTPEELFRKNLIKHKDGLVKILSKGKISKPLSISAHKFSKKAKVKIEEAGGSIEVLTSPPNQNA